MMGSCRLILSEVCSAFESLKSTGAGGDKWFNDYRMVQPHHMFLTLGLTQLLTCYTTASKFFHCSSPNPTVCIQAKPCNKILTCWIFYGKLQKHCFLPLAHRKIFWYHSPLRDKVKCATIWRQDVIKIKSNTSVEQWWPTFTLYFLLSSVVLKNHLPLALSLLHRHTFCNSQPRRSAVPEHPMTQRDPKSLSLAACLLNWDK